MVTVSCGPVQVRAESAEAAAVAMAREMLQGLPPAHGDDVERAALAGEVWAARELEARGPFAWTWGT
jgi:hypothetical protein